MASKQFYQGHDRNPDPLQAHSKRTNASELSASSPRTERSQLGADFQPSEYSVICGQGKASFDHPGNHYLRMLAGLFVADYSQAGRKLNKSAIVANVVAMIRQEGGCFCRYEKGTWFEVGDHYAREKVGNFFRNILHDHYRSSSEAKNTRRRQARMKQNETQTQQYGQQLAKTARRRDRAKQNETQTQHYGQLLVDGTRHPNDGTEHSCATPSSYGHSGGSNDSLGFDPTPVQ
jgi:hypothetical protein